MLLAAYDARRPTRDVDIQALALAGEREYVLQMIRAIAITPMDDGLVFNTHGATADVIRDEDECSGVRITMTATLASAELSLHIDVSVGDPIIPAPRLVNLPRLLGGSICVIGYPLPMVYAEKTMTVVQPGTVNTRWRDFADLFVLSGRNPVDGDEVQEALSAVATYRNVAPTTLAVALDGFAALAQSRWFAWRRKQHLDDRLPSAFAHVLDAVVAFADPPLKGAVSGKTSDPPPDHGRHRSIETVPTAL